eukprot:3829607-Rhodomonas_salina.1
MEASHLIMEALLLFLAALLLATDAAEARAEADAIYGGNCYGCNCRYSLPQTLTLMPSMEAKSWL